MPPLPYGYFAGLVAIGALVALTLIAPRRPRFLAGLAYRVAAAYNEVPFLFAYLVVVFSIGPLSGDSLDSLSGRVMLVLAALVVVGLLVIAWRGAQSRQVVVRALDIQLGPKWRGSQRSSPMHLVRKRPPLARILFMPFVFRPVRVKRVGNVSYGDAGRYNLLDVYHRRDQPEAAPVLVYFHGGGFHGGRKSFEGRALLFHLARRGWVTISANYRLRPQADFFDHLIDVKKVIAWVRQHGCEYGADPSTLFLAGGSAGGHLSSVAALTQNESRYQPTFEEADTSVSGVASLYGWYGGYYGLGGPESEVGVLGHSADRAPPFFVAHGVQDSLATIETARRFVGHLRASSPSPVVFVELPHGQHAFDLFHSFRFSAVVDGVEAFAASVSGTSSAATSDRG